MIITKKLSDKCLSFIKANTSTSEEDLEKIYYGIQVILLDISKAIILFGTAYLLGILKYTLIAFVVFGTIRSFAFGFHANSTLECIVINYVLFLGNVYLSLNLPINIVIKSILFIISFLLIILYAPADTEERPIVSKKLRRALKIKSILTVSFFYVMTFLLKNDIYSNLITISILQEAIVITPIAYKLFKKKYNNYNNV